MGYRFTNMQFNVFNVWLRDASPAAIKSEPEEDNGFYLSPQHNKTSKREYDDEEWVSYKLNQIFTVCFLFCQCQFYDLRRGCIIYIFVHRFEYKPKKVKTEHDKKAKKRKHEYEDDEEDEVNYRFF